MESIKSNLSLANESGSVLKTRGTGLGSGTMERAQQTNLSGVQDAADMFDECMAIFQAYEAQLDEDGNHIQELGLHFHDLDLNLAGRM